MNGIMAMEDMQAALRVMQRPLSQILLWTMGFASFGLGDTLTTLYGLSIGLHEGHPLLAPVMQSIGALPTMIVAKALILTLTLGVWAGMMWLQRPDLAIAIPAAIAGVGIVVTLVNLGAIVAATL